jgi:hypothetical protein
MDSWMVAVLVVVSVIVSVFVTRHLSVLVPRHLATGLLAIEPDLLARLVELERRFSLIGQAIIPVSTAFQTMLVRELTHFHTPEMDSLMAHIGPPSTLSEEETNRLVVLLRQRASEPDVPASERDAAYMLPAVMRRATAEALAMAEQQPTALRLLHVIPLAPLNGSTK